MSHAYERLSPDLILDAVQSVGWVPDGHQLSLNSYENRVIQIGIEDASPIVAKFYRPERWDDAAILEEHHFSLALQREEIPVVAPLQRNEQTLFDFGGFRFALFPRMGGRHPNLDDLDHLEWIGRFLGRIHLVGQTTNFEHRPHLTPAEYGWPARQRVLESPDLPAQHQSEYAAVSEHLLKAIDRIWDAARPEMIALHGDCHPGNILWTDNGPHLVDMDDCRTGPAIQDLWMLLSGGRQDMTIQLSAILDGYRMFCDFDTTELALIESLRGLRQLHHTAWIAARWSDPAFPRAFPWFEEPTYWQTHINDLLHQVEALQAPPIHLY